jgi:flagellar basal-body rod modification protein FlgD
MWHGDCSHWRVWIAGLCDKALSFRKERSIKMSSLSTITTVKDIQTDYMKLLVTQLQNQNPLEPLDNQEMASQLAQFSQLEHIEAMNTNFARVLATIEQTYASSLIGKEVSFIVTTEAGVLESYSGIVEQINNNQDGEITLVVDGYTIELQDVMTIK